MSNSTVETIERVGPLELSVINYVLIAISAVLGVVMLIGSGAIVYNEINRFLENKESKFRKKLQVRRKGISGKSAKRSNSIESLGCTAYIQLSETPTSGRGSMEGTPTSIAFNNSYSVSGVSA